MIEPVDKYFGIPMSEWIKRVPNELEVDGVGLWQIIPVGRDSFGLSGEPLVEFTQRCILALLSRGARPGRHAADGGWLPVHGRENNAEVIAELIIADWLESGRDPDENGLWFYLDE
jgi:hypothetical protein